MLLTLGWISGSYHFFHSTSLMISVTNSCWIVFFNQKKRKEKLLNIRWTRYEKFPSAYKKIPLEDEKLFNKSSFLAIDQSTTYVICYNESSLTCWKLSWHPKPRGRKEFKRRKEATFWDRNNLKRTINLRIKITNLAQVKPHQIYIHFK